MKIQDVLSGLSERIKKTASVNVKDFRKISGRKGIKKIVS
jgi:hypothetical protein